MSWLFRPEQCTEILSFAIFAPPLCPIHTTTTTTPMPPNRTLTPPHLTATSSGPLEATIANLQREIAAKAAAGRDLQRCWIVVQGQLVALQAENSEAAEAATAMGAQQAVMQQKQARLNARWAPLACVPTVAWPSVPAALALLAVQVVGRAFAAGLIHTARPPLTPSYQAGGAAARGRLPGQGPGRPARRDQPAERTAGGGRRAALHAARGQPAAGGQAAAGAEGKHAGFSTKTE